MKVVVVGGGIAGLASSLRLLRAGVDVTLLESSDRLGGLGTFFSHGGRAIERFYHCTMPTDDHLLRLVASIGLDYQYYWRETTMGMIVEGRSYPFNTALDLLRFTPLSFAQRIRLGVGSLAMRHLGREEQLDNTTVEEWLTSIFGPQLWNTVWYPLFRSKFGESAGEVPALYIWKRAGREGNRAVRGFPACGYAGLIDGLERAIRELGGEVHFETRVSSLRPGPRSVVVASEGPGELECDHVVSTLPPALLGRILPAELERQVRLPDLAYQGVVNMLMLLKRSPSGHYWTPVLASGAGFDGVVEMTALVDRTHYGGSHAVYLMRYTQRTSALYQATDEEFASTWTEQFLRLYPELSGDDVIEVRVFRAPFVEPVYPLGYRASKPGPRVDDRVWSASTAQVYPNITSWNASVALAESVVDALLAAA